MPCLICFDAYNGGNHGGNLARFACGHIMHADCANQHIVWRFQIGGIPSCPVCNTMGLVQGPAFLNIDEEDVQHFLINNPRVFHDLVNRNRALLLQQQIRITAQRVNALQHGAQLQNGQANNNGDAHTQSYEIPHYNLGMRIDNNGIFFSPMAPENLEEDDEESESEDDDDEPDVFVLGNLALVMQIDADNIIFTRIQN